MQGTRGSSTSSSSSSSTSWPSKQQVSPLECGYALLPKYAITPICMKGLSSSVQCTNFHSACAFTTSVSPHSPASVPSCKSPPPSPPLPLSPFHSFLHSSTAPSTHCWQPPRLLLPRVPPLSLVLPPSFGCGPPPRRRRPQRWQPGNHRRQLSLGRCFHRSSPVAREGSPLAAALPRALLLRHRGGRVEGGGGGGGEGGRSEEKEGWKSTGGRGRAPLLSRTHHKKASAGAGKRKG